MSTNFTIRRPTPVSNDSSDVDSTPTFKVPALPSHLRNTHKAGANSLLNPNGKRKIAFGDSDDEDDDAATDELVIGFDAMGAQRWVAAEASQNTFSYHSPKSLHAVHSVQGVAVKSGPLIIPAIPNKDWRAAARQRKGYRPDEGKIKVGVDGSQGGMGTKDAINSGPQQSGLIVYKKRKIEEDSDGDLKMEAKEEKDLPPKAEDKAMTDEQRAVNALLVAAKQASEGAPMEEMPLEAIPMTDSVDWRQPKSETDAYREDVATRPDSASLEDYQRIPVSQFGTALLMGMGWKPGQGASKSGKGPVEAHAPKARPALLGLGAKPTDVTEGSKSQSSNAKPSKKYVPVIAKEREKNGDSSRSDSRQSERDIDARESRDRRDYSKSRDRSRERGGGLDRSRSKERRDRRDDERDRNRHHEYDRRGERPRSKHGDEGREPEKPGEGRKGGTREDKYREGDRRDRDESKKRR
jgi:G-patch domain